MKILLSRGILGIYSVVNEIQDKELEFGEVTIAGLSCPSEFLKTYYYVRYPRPMKHTTIPHDFYIGRHTIFVSKIPPGDTLQIEKVLEMKAEYPMNEVAHYVRTANLDTDPDGLYGKASWSDNICGAQDYGRRGGNVYSYERITCRKCKEKIYGVDYHKNK